MSILQTLEKDLLAAMKAKIADKVSTLRMVKAAITNYQIEKKKDKLDDPEILEIIQSLQSYSVIQMLQRPQTRMITPKLLNL